MKYVTYVLTQLSGPLNILQAESFEGQQSRLIVLRQLTVTRYDGTNDLGYRLLPRAVNNKILLRRSQLQVY